MLPLLGNSLSESFFLNNQTSLSSHARTRGKLPSQKTIAKNDVTPLLEIDTTFMVISFKSLEDFDYAIHSFKPLGKQINNLTSIYSHENNSQIPNSKFLDSQLLNIKDSNRIVRLSSDSEVIDLLPIGVCDAS